MTQLGITLAGAAPAGLRETDGALVLGAATSLAQLATLPPIVRRLPLLAEAAALTAPAVGGGESIAAATVSGLAAGSASPAVAAALLALDAELLVAAPDAPDGTRAVGLDGVLADDASIVEIRIPEPARRASGAIVRTGAGLLAAVQMTIGDASVARAVRVVTAAPQAPPARVATVERGLMGRHPDAAVADAAAARLTGEPELARCVAATVSRAAERALRA